MNYSQLIWAVCIHVENHLDNPGDYRYIERVTGFSYRRIRQVFRECTGVTLSAYITARRIANAAFSIVYTTRPFMEIAMEYGFEQYDGFTRAFKRETGVTPTQFRKNRGRVGRRELSTGVWGPAVIAGNDGIASSENGEKAMDKQVVLNREQSNILLGVPKVEFPTGRCTPFPACLCACLNYMGQDVDYTWLMAASGAAFRMRWNTKTWDPGNVGITNMYDKPLEAYERTFMAAGRSFRILQRKDATKEEFTAFVKSEIEQGRPVIATGVVGPQEACIVAGYQNNGKTWLGWSFFQDRAECTKDVTCYENGYFITGNWWENEATQTLMAIGEEQTEPYSGKNILENAAQVLTSAGAVDTVNQREYAGGQQAYDLWASWLEDDKKFGVNLVLPLLFERYTCQADAQTMVGEGRHYAAEYLKQVAKQKPAVEKECLQAANWFEKVANLCNSEMFKTVGNYAQPEEAIQAFARMDTRKKLAWQIRQVKEYEAKATECILKAVEQLS